MKWENCKWIQNPFEVVCMDFFRINFFFGFVEEDFFSHSIGNRTGKNGNETGKESGLKRARARLKLLHLCKAVITTLGDVLSAL